MATRRRASQSSLTGSISDIQRRVKYLQNRQNPTRLGNQSVQRSAIQYRAVGTDQIAPNSIANDQIQADAIKRAQIDNLAVGTEEIDNLAVTDTKLATDAVISDKIKDGAVIDGKLGNASVNLVNMKPNSVDNTQLITDSVNFRTVDTNAIGNENMLDNSVGNSEMQNDSVGNAELRNDSVGFAELQSSSVGTSTLQTGSVTQSRIASGAVGSTQLANGAVTSDKLGVLAVTAGKINSGAVNQLPIIASNVRTALVQAGVSSGVGLTRTLTSTGVSLAVTFGDTSQTAARGNHGHGMTASDSNVIVLSSNVARSTHRHTILQGSSRDFKKNITDHTVANPKNILSLVPKRYQYKNSKRAWQEGQGREWLHGYMVEDILDLGFEELVGYDKDGKADSLNYSLLSMVILEVVKEQQKEIDNLKEKLERLNDH